MSRGCCEAVGCRALMLPARLFCAHHDAMLENDTRRVLEQTFRPGKRPSTRLLRALETARAEILFYQTNRHHMPRDAAFEW